MKKITITILMCLMLLLVGCTASSSFSLSINQLTIEIGESTFLPVTLKNLKIEELVITSSEVDIIQIEGMTIYAQDIGSTTLTITWEDQSATLEVTVTPVRAHLFMTSTILEVGKSLKIMILNFTDPEEFVWTIDKPLVSLNEFYVVNALSPGTVTISVTHKNDPTITGSLMLSIIPALPTLYTSSNLLEIGDEVQLLIDDSTHHDPELFNWTLSDPTILQLNNYYQVKALQEGSCTITITLKTNELVTAALTIIISNTNISTNPTTEPITGPLYVKAINGTGVVQAGEILNIEILGQLDPYHYRYQSSDSTIVGITDIGTVFGIKPGIAKIYVISKDDQNIRGTLTVTVEGTPNVNYSERLIAAGLSEEGYVEGYNNTNKFGEWFEYPNVAWCAIFVSWCSNQAGIGIDIIPKYSSVSYGMIWFQQHELFQFKENYIPKAGDIIFFASDGASHTGIVVTCDETRVYTIEGNTGNGVHQRNYDL
ncbi:MAG: CHAP domain-containing protein, partial [Bacilli bacterium]